jgi:hypothetical protein
MKLTRKPDGQLVLADNSLWLAAIFALAALPLFYAAIILGRGRTFFGACFFLLSSFLCMRKSVFTFDADRRLVRWHMLRFLKVTSGTVPFEKVRDIGMEATSGRGGNTNYRLTLLTFDGSIPLMSSYASDGKKYASIREQILAFMKGDTTSVMYVGG